MWPDNVQFFHVASFAGVAGLVLLITIVSMRSLLAPEPTFSGPRTTQLPWESYSRFMSLELVRTTHELNYGHGSGLMVPKGAALQLISLHQTTSGPRWSAKWISDDEDAHGIYVYPIPEEMLESLMSHS